MSDSAKPSASSAFVYWLWDWIKSIAVALVVWLILRTFLIQAFRIPSGSMENTLLVGDFLFVNKALYGAEVPLIHKRLPAIREPQALRSPGQQVRRERPARIQPLEVAVAGAVAACRVARREWLR